MISQLLIALFNLTLDLFLLVLECLDKARYDIINLLCFKCSQLGQLLNDIDIQQGEHRIQLRRVFLTLFE